MSRTLTRPGRLISVLASPWKSSLGHLLAESGAPSLGSCPGFWTTLLPTIYPHLCTPQSLLSCLGLHSHRSTPWDQDPNANSLYGKWSQEVKVGGGGVRWGGRQPVKPPLWVPGASSSHLGTRDGVEPVSASSCPKGERMGIELWSASDWQQWWGEGQDKGLVSLTGTMEARRSLQGKKCRCRLVDLGLKALKSKGRGCGCCLLQSPLPGMEPDT